MRSSQDGPTVNEALVRLGLGVVALVAAVMGFVGLLRFLPAPGIKAGEGWTDILFYTLQLFFLGSAPVQSASNLPVELNVARFLAPATTFSALGLAAKGVYDSTSSAVRARRLRDHTVVCGGGTPALLVARAVTAEGRTCVVVDVSSPGTDAHREADIGDADRALVMRVGGDPRDAQVLHGARVARAREIVVVTGDSARNADVTAGLRTALAEVAEPPRCFLEMSSPELAAALAAHEINSGSSVRMEVFDPTGRSARRLLDAYLPSVAEGGSLLVVGSGPQHDAVVDDLDRRVTRGGATISWTALAAAELAAVEASPELAVVVVCVDDDLAAVRIGLRLLRRLHDRAVEVVVAVGSSTALGAVISGDDLAVSTVGRARLHVFNTTDHIYSMTSLREGMYLDMARAAHEAYVRQARLRGEDVHDNPSTVPWEQLDDDLRRANMEQAFAISDKLRELGCAVVPRDGADTPFAFDDDEVERLARIEHERWMTERERSRWRQGPRDDAARTHPDLVRWDQLTEQSRQKDRDAVVAIPQQLREVDLQIIRGGLESRGR